MNWFRPKETKETKQAHLDTELAWACCWMAIQPERYGKINTNLGSNIINAVSEDEARGKTWETLMDMCPTRDKWVGHMIGVLPIIYEKQKKVQQ